MTDIFHPDNELFDAIALPATLVDAEGIILDVNQAFVEHARRRGVPLTREERIGRPIADFAHDGESRGYIEDVVEQVLSAGETHQLAVRQRDGSGRLFYVDIHARALRDRDGTVRGAVIMREDVTERVQQQEQHARELEDRMAERHLLEEQLRQAQKMEAVGQLTAGIAHNFNNLLQGILGNVSLSLAEAPDLLKPLLEDAESAGNRAAEMVRQLMVFSRQGIQPAYEPVDVAALLRDVVDICRRTFDRRIHIQVREPRAPVQVAGSRGQLEQTLMNLLINARDALDVGATRQPSIRVSAESVTCGPDERVSGERLKPGAYVRIRVQDSGRGIDPEIRERVFEPFFTTKEVGAGTGLGLSMVYGIVHQHGGAIDCASEPEAGSTFSVYLPVMVREEKVYSEADAAPVERGAETILVIDDEEVVRRSARLMLEKFGYTVLQAAEGLEGLEVLQREGEQIDLVLLDLSMPRMSGQETLEKIRALRSDLKVVLFTGYASEEGEFEGVDGIAQKPFSGRDLVRLIRRALDA